MQNTTDIQRTVDQLTDQTHQTLREVARANLAALEDHIDPLGTFRGLHEALGREGDLEAHFDHLLDLIRAWHSARRLELPIAPRTTGAVRFAMAWLAVLPHEIQAALHRVLADEGIYWIEIPGAVRG